MPNLIILSEINNLEYLKNHGVYPSEFYTDFNTFRNKASNFRDANIVCIFAGTCAFSKRVVLEFFKTLTARMEDEDDFGVSSVAIISDTFLPTCKEYYLYVDNLYSLKRYSGWKCKQKLSDFWATLDYTPCAGTVSHLSAYDNMDTSSIMKRVKNINTTGDKLIEKIRIPDILIK